MKKHLGTYILVFLLALFLCFTFFYLKLQKERKLAAAQKVEELRAEIARKDPNRKEIFATSSPYFSSKIEYPRDYDKVKERMFSFYNSFLEETNIANIKTKKDAEQAAISQGQKYEFSSSYKVATSSEATSFIIQNYTYTGGAHGSVGKSVVILDRDYKYLPPDYFVPGATMKNIYDFIYTDLKKQIEERSEKKLEDDSMLRAGIAPNRGNYLVLWPEGDDTVVIYFGQYQVAPYAYGDFEVRVPKSMIK